MSNADKAVVVLLAIAGIAISLFSYRMMFFNEEADLRASFQQAAIKKTHYFSQGVERYKSILKSMVYYYNASEHISREEFNEFVRDIIRTEKAFRALEWLPRVSESDRESFVRDVRNQGFPNFEITQKDAEGNVVRRSRSSEYFPILYVEPYANNEAALGFDPSSEPIRLQALKLSWDSGKIHSTEPLRLVQEPHDGLGFLVFAPVYRKGAPIETVEDRRENLAGFFLAVFNLKEFMEGAFGFEKDDGVDVFVYGDSPSDAGRLLFTTSRNYKDRPESETYDSSSVFPAVSYETNFDNMGRKWTIKSFPSDGGPFTTQRSGMAIVTLVCGLLMTALISTYVAFLKIGKLRSEQLASMMTQAKSEIETETSARNEAMGILRERELQFRNIFENSMDGIMLTRIDGSILRANSAACRILGWSEKELNEIGRDGIVDQQDSRLREGLETRLAEGRVTAEVTFRRKDGELFPAQVSSGVFEDENGDVFSAVVFRDITSQRKDKELLRTQLSQTKALIDNIPDLVWLKDAEGHFVTVNEAFSASCGTPSDKISGKTDFEVWPEEMARAYVTDDMEVIRSGVTKIVEEPVADVKNAMGWIETIKTPIFGPDGQVLGTAGTARDITARVLAEQTRKLLEKAVEQCAESIMITDAEGAIEYVNPAFENVSGYSGKEVIGLNLRILWSGELDESFHEQMWQTLRAGRVWSGMIISRRRGGAIVYEQANISPVKDHNGALTAYVAVNRDVTEERLLEEQLVQSQKMEAIGALAGGIAHDFNNIIFAIIGYAELVSVLCQHDEQAVAYLDEILKASDRAGQMVRQILTFSRQSNPEKAVIDIVPVVKEGLKFLRGATASSIDIQTDIERNLPKINADPTQIYQVLLNLCTNAVHAMEGSNGILSVTLAQIELEEDFASVNPSIQPGIFVRLTVKDSGVGMSPETMKRIFEPYYTTKNVGEGTGLGLSVLDGIVKDHGGVVTVWSKPGKGSRFSVYFPAVHDDNHETLQVEEEFPRQGDESILWVDDELTLMQMCKQTLENVGFKVTFKTDPLEALETFKMYPETFDLVITDLSMPKMSGFDLSRELSSVRPGIPLLMCTGFGKSLSKEQTETAGILKVISKPISSKDLISVIREILDRSAV